jgi:hypothetical protein
MMSLKEMWELATIVGSGVAAMAACDTPTIRSRPYAGGPQIGIVQILVPGTTGPVAQGDLYSGKLQFPARFLMFTYFGSAGSVGPPNVPPSTFNVLVHFARLGLQYTTNDVDNVPGAGVIPWINMGWAGSGSWIKFEPGSEIQEFYIDADGATANSYVTFIYSNGIDSAYLNPTT